jgi:hypothetical protein
VAAFRIARCAIEDFPRLFIDKIMAPDSLSFTPKGETTRCRILIGGPQLHTSLYWIWMQRASLGSFCAAIPIIGMIILKLIE